MAVAVTVDIPGGTEQGYEQVVATLFPEGKRERLLPATQQVGDPTPQLRFFRN
jgi:hypothetical protein